MGFSMEECRYESESDSQFSDNSQNDPSFDFVEETRLKLSDFSLKRKSKRPNISGVKENNDEEEVEEFDAKDEQSYEIIQKMIQAGQVDKLKVEQCKIYLRKHGLRLSGKKDILIDRIKEHVDIVNGGGEEKYPVSSFVLNCKGDSCKGDVVMFEQNVYEEFSIKSRSSNGGPCGTRVVAGRILKESYGAAKQQHTFTIEVLWSRGEKPLPPLHPLLIKGRNLYRMNTMRQKWEDEGERQRILLEKHARGGAARSNRDARKQQQEMRKTQRATRATRNEHPNRKKEERSEPLHFVHQQQQQSEAHCHTRTQEINIPIRPVHQRQPLTRTQEINIPIQPVHQRQPLTRTQEINIPIQPVHRRQPLMAVNCNFPRAQLTVPHPSDVSFIRPRIFPSNSRYPGVPAQPQSLQHMQNRNTCADRPIHQQGNEQRQICRYFGQGRCYFGDRCKYSHVTA